MTFDWYAGRFHKYSGLPWFNGSQQPPYTVIDVHPMGYLVLQTVSGCQFKMLNNPPVSPGDVLP